MAKVPAASLTKEDVKRRIKLLAKQTPPYFAGKEDLDRPVDADIEVTGPWYNRKLTLIVEGFPVSLLGVIEHQQRIGPCVVRMGGIAGVSTHEDHRFKGYSRRVMLNSLRWMRREGYDVSMLYGITGFYPKFGFATAFPKVVFAMPVKEAERAAEAGKAFRFVDFAPGHLSAVLKMYHANNASRTGVTLRDPKIWRPFRKGVEWRHDVMAKVALDARGKAVGYLAWDVEMEAAVTEVGFATPAVFPALAGAAAGLARSTINFYLPEDDAFMDWCKPLGLQ
jgi:GNAT superfamily N-acetyltransferase